MIDTVYYEYSDADISRGDWKTRAMTEGTCAIMDASFCVQGLVVIAPYASRANDGSIVTVNKPMTVVGCGYDERTGEDVIFGFVGTSGDTCECTPLRSGWLASWLCEDPSGCVVERRASDVTLSDEVLGMAPGLWEEIYTKGGVNGKGYVVT